MHVQIQQREALPCDDVVRFRGDRALDRFFGFAVAPEELEHVRVLRPAARATGVQTQRFVEGCQGFVDASDIRKDSSALRAQDGGIGQAGNCLVQGFQRFIDARQIAQ